MQPSSPVTILFAVLECMLETYGTAFRLRHVPCTSAVSQAGASGSFVSIPGATQSGQLIGGATARQSLSQHRHQSERTDIVSDEHDTNSEDYTMSSASSMRGTHHEHPAEVSNHPGKHSIAPALPATFSSPEMSIPAMSVKPHEVAVAQGSLSSCKTQWNRACHQQQSQPMRSMMC